MNDLEAAVKDAVDRSRVALTNVAAEAIQAGRDDVIEQVKQIAADYNVLAELLEGRD